MKNNKRNLRFGILWADPYPRRSGRRGAFLFDDHSVRGGIAPDRHPVRLHAVGSESLRSRHARHGTGTDSGPDRTAVSYGRRSSRIRKGMSAPTRSGSGRRCSHSIFCGTISSLDIGAGDSYSDIYGITRFRNMDFTKSWARRLRRQYILLPQTMAGLTPARNARPESRPVDERSRADFRPGTE